MKPITIVARMGVPRDRFDEVAALAAEGCRAVADEPGTLAYDWHYSAEHETLLLIESYADSDAHFVHMQADGHGEFMGRLMSLIDSVEFVVLGDPTPEHSAALSSVPGAQFFSEVASI